MVWRSWLLVLFAGVTTGQSEQSEQVFRFAQAETPLARQEINHIMRSIAEIRDSSVDMAAGTMTVRGTAAPLGLAHQAPGAAAHGMQQYQVSGESVPYLRIFFLANTTSLQGTQEIVSTLRSIGEIQRITGYTPNAAIVLRGTPEQIALAAWMVQQLDQPAQVRRVTAVAGYPPGLAGLLPYPARPSDEIVKAHTETAQALQALANQIRSTAGMQRVVYTEMAQALTLPGTAVQMAAPEQLIQAADK